MKQIFNIILLSLIITNSLSTKAQVSISGQVNCIVPGSTYHFVAIGWTQPTYSPSKFVWSGPGTISSPSSGQPYIDITFPSTFNYGYITLDTKVGAPVTLFVTTAAASFTDPGTIVSLNGSNIYLYQLPEEIYESTPPNGSCNPSNFSYQYEQSSAAAGPFVTISGATSEAFTPSASNTPQTIYYRRKTTVGGASLYSNVVSISFVTQAVTAGQISVNDNVYYNTNPTVYNTQSAAGTECIQSGLQYSWQLSTDAGNTWQNIGSGELFPQNVLITVNNSQIRRVVTCGSTTAYSNIVFIQFKALDGGTISTTNSIVVNGYKPNISQQPASGGNGPISSYVYTWQQSPDGTAWQNIGTGVDYPQTAPVFNGNTQIRRSVTLSGVTVYSNIIPFSGFNANTLADNQNYVSTQTINKPGIIDPNTVPSLIIGDKSNATTYYDGLGRSLEEIQQQASGNAKDIVTYHAYDDYGREALLYMPYSYPKTNTDQFSNNGKIKFSYTQEQTDFNNILYPGEIAYAQNIYENSPLARVTKQLPQGNNWIGSGRGITTDNLVNTESDAVRIWNIGSAQLSLPTSSDIYKSGTLKKTVVTDLQGHKTISYNDFNDRLILKKVQLADDQSLSAAHDGWSNIYYVYDEMNNLRMVMSPLAVEKIKNNWVLSQAIADELCFQYQFDEFGRTVVKKTPGSNPAQMVYDALDRLVFKQDGVQAKKSPTAEWLTYFYDGLNREVMSAIYPSNATRSDLQTAMNNVTANISSISYTVPGTADLVVVNRIPGQLLYEASNSVTMQNGFESEPNAEFSANINGNLQGTTENVTITNPLPNITGYQPLTFTYYDDYNFPASKAISNTLSGASGYPTPSNVYPEAQIQQPFPQGLKTGSKIRVLNTNQWLSTTSFYDYKGRPIQSRQDNISTGEDIVSNQYDFSDHLLITYQFHTNPLSATIPSNSLRTITTYDNSGRSTSITQRLNDDPKLERLILTNDYDEIGRISHARINNNAASAKEVQQFNYNVRGWLMGINTDFVETDNSATNWFGEEYGYDNGFATTYQYGGSLSSTKWKSKANGIPRVYAYGYDNMNRLAKADYLQQDQPGESWSNAKVNFMVDNLKYDANGNILSLSQYGLKGITSSVLDSLAYIYADNSNKLNGVMDATGNQNTGLGDFTDGNTGVDYTYDENGNLKKDLNKNISAITYNYLNLPETITIPGKGSVSFQYDARGIKLTKTVLDNTQTPVKQTITSYESGFTYQNDSLQFIGHNNGRIRVSYKQGQIPQYAYDFFLKDHLESIRMILTEKSDTAQYAATMENGNSATENALFSNIDNTRTPLPTNYPTDGTTNPNNYVARLNAKTGQKIGPSIVLRVMAGDTISIGTKSYYTSTTSNTTYSPASDIIAALLQTFAAGGIADGVHMSSGASSPLNNGMNTTLFNELKSLPGSENSASKPKAYLSFVLFDDQFNMVSANSGERQVQATPGVLQNIMIAPMAIKSTGFIYIYTSNESDQDVFFDNLVINHISGPLLEETHYYPFGLTMTGISSHAMGKLENRFKYDMKELQSNEFTDGAGLNWYDYGMRMYDPQIGRWNTIDPKTELLEMSSPFAYGLNSPNNFIDKDGELPIFINGRVMDDKERGQKGYWQGIVETVANSGIPNPGGEIHLVDGDQYLYINPNTLSEHLEKGSWTTGHSPSIRIDAGSVQAARDFNTILSKLARDPKTHKIIEKIQIYTHSRGAAFGIGYTETLLALIQQHAEEFADATHEIDFVLNLAPHQSWTLTTPKGVKEYSIHHSADLLSGNSMKGSYEMSTSESSDDMLSAHSISSFQKDISTFISSFTNGGTTADLIQSFVKKMKNDFNIQVTVYEQQKK